jgi:hypothetical protein
LSYLRFTRQEYRAVALLCRPLDLGDDFFPHFKHFLIASLLETVPDLAKRIALFRTSQLRLLFDHLRGRKARAGDLLTAAEFRALSRACNAGAHPHRFLHFYKDTLVRHFRQVRPSLARKLGRMSEDQFRELYGRVRKHRRKG